MNVFIVNHYFGSYDDAVVVTLKAFLKQEKAQKFINELEIRVKKRNEIEDHINEATKDKYEQLRTMYENKKQKEREKLYLEISEIRHSILNKLALEELCDFNDLHFDSNFGIQEIELVE